MSERKYFPGPTITSLDDLMMCEKVFHFDKVICNEWFQNWNLNFTKKQLEANAIRHAIKISSAACMIALVLKNKVVEKLNKIDSRAIESNWEVEFVELRVDSLSPKSLFCTVCGKLDCNKKQFFEVRFTTTHEGAPEDQICNSCTESDSIEELYEVAITTAKKAFEIIYSEKKDA